MYYFAFVVTAIVGNAALWHYFVLSWKDTWLLIRIAIEFIRGFRLMRGVKRAVTVFGSARLPNDSPKYVQVRRIGEKLGRRRFVIVTGDGPGAMGGAHEGGQLAGAKTVGVGIKLNKFEPPNPFATHRKSFMRFFTRKVMLVRYADGFIITDYGAGTLDETFELITLMQLDKTRRVPIYFIDEESARDFHDLMLNMLRRGTISPDDVRLCILVGCPNIPVVTVTVFNKKSGQMEDVSMPRLPDEDAMIDHLCAVVEGKIPYPPAAA